MSNWNFYVLAMISTATCAIVSGAIWTYIKHPKPVLKKRRFIDIKNAVTNNDIEAVKSLLSAFMPLFDSNTYSGVVMHCLTEAVYQEKLKIVELVLDAMGDKQKQIDWWSMTTDTLIMSNACLQLMIKKAPHLVVHSSLLTKSTHLLLDFKLIAPCMFRADARRYKKSRVIHSWAQSNLLNRFFYILFRQDIVSIVLANPHLPR